MCSAVKHCPAAWLTRLYTLFSHARPHEPAVDWLFARMPDVYRGVYRPDFVPDAEDCRASLRSMLEEELGPLRTSAARLEREIDGPGREGASARSLLLRDPEEARKFLRYLAESRSTFHRAFRELTRVLEHDAAEGRDVGAVVAGDLNAPADSPNEPDQERGQSERAASAEPPVSPNEPDPPAGPRADCEDISTSDDPAASRADRADGHTGTQEGPARVGGDPNGRLPADTRDRDAPG